VFQSGKQEGVLFFSQIRPRKTKKEENGAGDSPKEKKKQTIS